MIEKPVTSALASLPAHELDPADRLMLARQAVIRCDGVIKRLASASAKFAEGSREFDGVVDGLSFFVALRVELEGFARNLSRGIADSLASKELAAEDGE